MFFHRRANGYAITGHTAAVESGEAWAASYDIAVDESWVTRSAHVTSFSEAGTSETRLSHDGEGHWQVEGAPEPDLEGCLDVDLETSACTNTLVVRRLSLELGEGAATPAAYVRRDLTVEVLDQSHLRLPGDGPDRRFAYRAPAFDFNADLVYDAAGLIVDYPGIASRRL